MDCTHNELGAALAEKWDFPPALTAVIAYHSLDQLPQQYRRETAVANCASGITIALEIGETVTPRVNLIREEAWEAAGVKAERLGAAMDEVLKEMESTRMFVDLLYS